MGRGVWQATVHAVIESDTTEWLSNLAPKKPTLYIISQERSGQLFIYEVIIFLVVCIHSKGDDDAIIDAHHILSDFTAKWVQIRLTLVTKDTWLNNYTIPSSQNPLGFWSCFRCWNCGKKIVDLYCQINLWIDYHPLLIYLCCSLSTVGIAITTQDLGSGSGSLPWHSFPPRHKQKAIH